MKYRKISLFFFIVFLESFSGMNNSAHAQWVFANKRVFTQITASGGSELYGISKPNGLTPSFLWFSADLGQSWTPSSAETNISGFTRGSTGRFYLSSPSGIDTAFDPNCPANVCWETLPNHNLLDTVFQDSIVTHPDLVTALFVRAATDGSKGDELWVGTVNALWYRKMSDTVWIKKDTSVKGTAIEQITASGKNIYYRTGTVIFASNDGGSTWHKSNQSTFGVITSILAPNDTDFYYSVTTQGNCSILHSTDAGKSFDGVKNSSFGNRTIRCLAVNSFGDVFLGGGVNDGSTNLIIQSFLMKFNHDGAGWQFFSDGLPTTSPSPEILCITFTPDNVGVVSTDSQGTWTTGKNAVKNVANQSGIALMQNYPNPTNSLTEFSASTDHPVKASIAVFDALGKNVLQVLDGELTTGTTSFRINTKDLAIGTYFYRLQTPEATITKTFVVAR